MQHHTDQASTRMIASTKLPASKELDCNPSSLHEDDEAQDVTLSTLPLHQQSKNQTVKYTQSYLASLSDITANIEGKTSV